MVFCTPPKPGNATNPIDVINEELKHSHLPLPEAVETNVKRLQSASMFLFSCWIIGPAIGFFAAVAGVLIGCRTKGGGWIIGITAFVPDHLFPHCTQLTHFIRSLGYSSFLGAFSLKFYMEDCARS